MSEKLRVAARQALEVLEAGPDVDPIFAGETEAVLEAALAEPEPVQEPYCHIYEYDSAFGQLREFYPHVVNGRKPDRTVPLYNHPPQRPPLTDEEIKSAAESEPFAVFELMYGHEITAERFRHALNTFARAVERAVRGEKE